MCYYTDVLGQGAALVAQIITLVAIALSIAFWVLMYRKHKVDIVRYAVPIAFWIVFGSLDIIITARGTIGNPMLEDNPLTRGILVLSGDYGPAIASILWISLWAFIVLVINKRLKPGLAIFISLAVFYSLAVGHFLGFSSWFDPLCTDLSLVFLQGWQILIPGIIAMGCILAAAHVLIGKWVSKQLYHEGTH